MNEQSKFKNAILSLSLLYLCFLTTPALGISEARLKTYLNGTDYRNVRLSPDGKHLSVMTKRDDKNTLVVLDIATMKPTASVKYEEDMKIEILDATWINSDTLWYTTSWKSARLENPYATPYRFVLSADGKRNDRIWSVYGNYSDNTKGRGDLVRGLPSLIAKLPEDKNRVMIFVKPLERRDGAGRGGIYTLNIVSGDTREKMRVPEYTMWVISTEDGNNLVASSLDSESKIRHFYSVDGGGWQKLTLTINGDEREFETLEVTEDFIYVKVQKTKTIDAATLVKRYQISTNKWETVFDAGFAVLNAIDVDDDGKLTRVHWTTDKPRISILEKSDPVSQVVNSFAKTYPGLNIYVVSKTDDDKSLIIFLGSGAYSGEYFLFDSKTRKARFLLATMEGIDGNELAEPEDASFTTADGVRIPGWFQAPRGIKQPPLVVNVHGGPHGPYNSYRFHANWHIFNELGYAVYAPNFRGSGGYGLNFEHAGYRLWGTRMLDDIYEGVQSLIKQKRVDGNRVCIAGGSYGGYASTQSLVRYNKFYRCGVIIAGFFDARTQIKRSDTARWYAGDDYMVKAIGEGETALRAMSPMFHIDSIEAPMLILHGKEDERTPFKGAVEFVKALKKKGKKFQYQWYKNEGHGNVKLENRVDEWRRVEAFLKESNP